MTNETNPDTVDLRGVHMSHCNQGDHEGSCKYGDDDCPALAQSQPAATVQEANTHSTPGDAEVRKAVAQPMPIKRLIEAIDDRPEVLRGYDNWSVTLSSDDWKRIRALYATPSGRAQAWLPIEDAPRDGTEIVAAIKVRHIKGGIWWERHVIAADEETGELHPDYDHGWTFDDYELWMSLADLPDLPAAPPAQDQTKGDEA